MVWFIFHNRWIFANPGFVSIDYRQFANTPTLVYASTPTEEITAVSGVSYMSIFPYY